MSFYSWGQTKFFCSLISLPSLHKKNKNKKSNKKQQQKNRLCRHTEEGFQNPQTGIFIQTWVSKAMWAMVYLHGSYRCSGDVSWSNQISLHSNLFPPTAIWFFLYCRFRYTQPKHAPSEVTSLARGGPSLEITCPLLLEILGNHVE